MAYNTTDGLAKNLIRTKINGTWTFDVSSKISSRSMQDFDSAFSVWNAAAGKTLLKRSSQTHSLVSYPSEDGVCQVYKELAGSTYLGQTHYHYDYSSSPRVYLSADINMNAGQSFSNDQQSGYYDVWSVFLHEAGHVIGLGHRQDSSIKAVMDQDLQKGELRRYLSQDDKNGVNFIYK